MAAAMSTAIYGGRDNRHLGLGLVRGERRRVVVDKDGGRTRSAPGGWRKPQPMGQVPGSFSRSLSFALLTIGLSGMAFIVVFGMLSEMTLGLSARDV